MRHFLLIIFSFLFLNGSSQDPAEMNLSAIESYFKADDEMKDILKTILNEYKLDTVFTNNLIASQKIWISFRDAELKVKYPGNRPGFYYNAPMCSSIYLEKLTRERIATLKKWLDGIEEGDICKGSIKMKQK